MSVNVLDLGYGNLPSVVNALRRLNVRPRVVREATKLDAGLLILPGVGSAGTYMDHMLRRGFVEAIKDHVGAGHALLGICLGFQLLGRGSEEDGGVEGLGLIDADTVHLGGHGVHNGWEPLHLDTRAMAGETLRPKLGLSRQKILNGRVFYNHEFGVRCSGDAAFTVSIGPALDEYSAMVVQGPVVGVQFHPEKSQSTGLSLLRMMV